MSISVADRLLMGVDLNAIRRRVKGARFFRKGRLTQADVDRAELISYCDRLRGYIQQIERDIERNRSRPAPILKSMPGMTLDELRATRREGKV